MNDLFSGLPEGAPSSAAPAPAPVAAPPLAAPVPIPTPVAQPLAPVPGAPFTPDLSVVVPVYDEAQSLPELYNRMRAAAGAAGFSYEFLFIDDGSTDDTPRVLRQLAADDPAVRVISFRRNFGKSAALAVAFARVRGRYVLTLDGDLQDDPAELSRLLEALESRGLDLVSGWKQVRHDPWTKTWPSKLFNSVTAAMCGLPLHDFNCGLKLYRREVVESIEVYGEFHRFLPALAHWRGFRVGELPVTHHARQYGKSKFGAARFINGFLDLIAAMFLSRNALKPLHVFGRMALLSGGAGLLISAWFFVTWLLKEPVRVRPLFVLGLVLIVVAVQLLLMGLLGEMIAHLGAHRIYSERRRYNLESGE
jgi:glycosyltransferase involved in cell wall biosynthesis